MEIQPIDLPAVIAIVMGSLIVLIPVAGATLRFAVKPLVEALLQSGALGVRPPANEAELARLSRRVLELEQAMVQQRKLELPLPVPVEGAAESVPANRLRSA